jgi:Tol biopolymer transport system component
MKALNYKIFAAALSLAMVLSARLARAHHATFPANARLVIDSHMYDDVDPVCSPDGRWLAFEYHETNDPIYPHIAIMDLTQHSNLWQPLLKAEPGRHLFVGDLSWSPDSRWLAVITDYPKGGGSFWSRSDSGITKVNIYTHEVVRLTTALPEGARLGPTTAWLRSGLIVFSGMLDDNIYGVSENGGFPQKLINVPTDKCGGGPNTFAISPNEQKIAFVMDDDNDNQFNECNALWIGNLRTGDIQRFPTAGLHPLAPFWLNKHIILFSGINTSDQKWLPMGLYSLDTSSGQLTRLLKGLYVTPSICADGKTLYFSWAPRLQTKNPAGSATSVNNLYGFHIWKMSLRDVLR